MWGRYLIPSSCSLWLSLWSIGWYCSFAAASGNSSKMQYIYNMTLCELNGTDWLNSKFDYAVESYVLFPIVTHIISMGALTTSHFLDTVGLTTVATAGYYHGRYVLSSINATCALAAFICFAIRATKNCMSWRYACTRFTNFVTDTKGRFYRYKSPILIERAGRVELGEHLVEVKHVVQEGSLAKPITKVAAERWGN